MKLRITKMLLMAIAATVVGNSTQASVRSKNVVIETPADLPELARMPSQAMFLYYTDEAQVILYLEQDQGRTLAILDVTDPSKIKPVGKVTINAPATYDFIQDLDDFRTLIHYRDHSGFALLNFKNYKAPVLTPEPDYLHPATTHADRPSGLLLVTSSSNSNVAAKPIETQYEVLNISEDSDPKPLATIQKVIQRVDRPLIGTIFLLTDEGVTVVRCLVCETDNKIDFSHTP